MATLTIRDIDEETHAQLRMRAARHGRSMEAELREIIKAALARPEGGLGTRIHRRFAAVGGVELDLPERTEKPRAPKFH